MEKPECQLIGTDGNVFAMLGECRKALKAAGMKTEANELGARLFSCHSYDEALAIMGEYVEIV